MSGLADPERTDGWVGVELRHLIALAAVDEARSFRGAAERLGYVQSAVSQQIAQLEALVGARLVDRGRARPVRLTDAGTVLVGHGRRMLGQLDAARADLRLLERGAVRTLRVGAVQSVAAQLIPRTLLALARRQPGLEVVIDELAADRAAFARVAAGELDAAFAELPLAPGPFAASVVLEDPCVLLVPAGSPLAGEAACPTLAALAAQPLVAINGWPMMEQIEARMLSAGVRPRVIRHADTNATVQAFVGAGVGAAIMPRLAVNRGDRTVVAIDLSALLPPRRLAFYWHRERREADALDALRDAVADAARLVAS